MNLSLETWVGLVENATRGNNMERGGYSFIYLFFSTPSFSEFWLYLTENVISNVSHALFLSF